MRLWLRAEIAHIITLIHQLVEAGVDRAEREIDYVMPGYTHLQRAPPIRWSHWILSHCWPWVRDAQRFDDIAKRMNKCPLGNSSIL